LLDAGVDLKTIELSGPSLGVVVATMSPPSRTLASDAVRFEDLERLSATAATDPDARVVVLTGADDTFFAGFAPEAVDDLSSLSTLQILNHLDCAARAVAGIRSLHLPVIAAVNGSAAGAGLSLALAACIRVAARSASFSAESMRYGLSAGDLGLSWMLPRLVGPAIAAEIAYTGRTVGAVEAERVGLINELTEDDGLLDRAIAMAEVIARNSPAAVQLSKRVLQSNLEIGSYQTALEMENRGQALLTRGRDMREALAAYLSNRAPVFTGE
jgi:enoyl-CoA hydratase/carnithine racemase